MAQISQSNHEPHHLRALSHSIIGAAMTVHNELRPGLDEKLYERALLIELKHRGHEVSQQREFPVRYRGQTSGTLIPDLLVDGTIIADPKVVDAFGDHHIAQMTGYLVITQLELALLLNFKHDRLQVKRVIRSNQSEASA